MTDTTRPESGRRKYFVALLNEKIGPAPHPSYGEYLRSRSESIQQHLDHVRRLSLAVSRDGRRRTTQFVGGGSATIAPNDTSTLLVPASKRPIDRPKSGQAKRTRRARSASVAAVSEEDSDEDSPVGKESPIVLAAATVQSSASSAAMSGRERATEKTHLVVCENPLALLDELNRSRRGDAQWYTYMACATGPFEQERIALRYRKKWGEGSRGSGPRASWGDAFSQMQGVQFFTDPEVIFSSCGPSVPSPELLPRPVVSSDSAAAMVAAAAAAAQKPSSTSSSSSSSSSSKSVAVAAAAGTGAGGAPGKRSRD